jgi:hypothetical protein
MPTHRDWCLKCGRTTAHSQTAQGWVQCTACGFVGTFLTTDGESIEAITQKKVESYGKVTAGRTTQRT